VDCVIQFANILSCYVPYLGVWFKRKYLFRKLRYSQVSRWGRKNPIRLEDLTISWLRKMSVNHVMSVLTSFLYVQTAIADMIYFTLIFLSNSKLQTNLFCQIGRQLCRFLEWISYITALYCQLVFKLRQKDPYLVFRLFFTLFFVWCRQIMHYFSVMLYMIPRSSPIILV